MNYTQNQKIEQVTESTLVLGVDIGSSEHYVRAFDYRGRELTRKVFRFSTDINGFNSFYDWVTQICIKHGKNEAMIGCEPTGHYWYTFYQFVKDHGMKLAFVNPASVKKAKELDDNSPKKTDLKDPKTIAKLVIDGRYSFPYVPEGIYAEIREVTSSRDRIMKELNAASNRIQSNKEFRSIYDYYRKRIKNPLKGRQAMIAVGCKLIRGFFAIMTKGVVYNGSKMIEDIHRPTQLPQAA